jgi:hypothetical protein
MRVMHADVIRMTSYRLLVVVQAGKLGRERTMRAGVEPVVKPTLIHTFL